MSSRTPITLVCSACGARNYRTTKARKKSTGVEAVALELKKYCATCAAHTVHRESK